MRYTVDILIITTNRHWCINKWLKKLTWVRLIFFMSIFLCLFPQWTTDEDLSDAIRSIGINDVLEIKFFENRANGQSKGWVTQVLLLAAFTLRDQEWPVLLALPLTSEYVHLHPHNTDWFVVCLNAGLRWCVLVQTPLPENFWTCCPSGSFTGKTPLSHHATNSPSASLRCSPGKVRAAGLTEPPWQPFVAIVEH